MSQATDTIALSIIIPAKNEVKAIGDIVATVVKHPESLGNGAAVKSGARAAHGEIFAFMDGDGQLDASEFSELLEKLDHGYEMAIGARHSGSHANVGRLFANGLYNRFASIVSGRNIPDLTSGPRKVFLPISGLFFATGLGYYAYTYFTMSRFTYMSMLVLSASVIILLIGLISEQITTLTYSKS